MAEEKEETSETPKTGKLSEGKITNFLSGHKGQSIAVVIGAIGLVIAFITYRAIHSQSPGNSPVNTGPGTSGVNAPPDTGGVTSSSDTSVSLLSQIQADEQKMLAILQGQHQTTDGTPAPSQPPAIQPPAWRNAGTGHGFLGPPWELHSGSGGSDIHDINPPAPAPPTFSPPSEHPASSILGRRFWISPTAPMMPAPTHTLPTRSGTLISNAGQGFFAGLANLFSKGNAVAQQAAAQPAEAAHNLRKQIVGHGPQ
jgi:hypothetical protein